MKIRWLEYFVTVADEQSVSRATVRLNTSQAALSRVIREMEATLSVELFQRTGRGMILTPEGRVLRDHANMVIQSYNAFLGKARELSGTSVASLQVMLPMRLSAFVMQAFTKHLSDAYDGVKAEVFEALSEDIQTRLRAKEADIAVYYSPRSFDADNGERIATEALYLSGSPDIVGESSDPITMQEASSMPLILQSESAVFRKFVQQSFAENGYGLRVKHSVNTISGQLHYARNGEGATILPYSSVGRDTKSGALVTRLIVESEIRRDVYIATSSQALTRMQRDAVSILKTAIEAASADLRWDIVKD